MEINIIGMGNGKELAPMDGICWGITRLIHERPVNVLFDIHRASNLRPGGAEDMFRRIKAAEEKGAVHISCDKHENQNSMAYPLDDILRAFGCAFFADSISYALALAIYQGAKVINLYGVNQAKANHAEYHYNKPATDYWVGFARGRGIEVNVFGDITEVCKTRSRKIYGYNIDQQEALDRVRSL